MFKRPGIYAIKNAANGKMYIGSSGNLTRRYTDHRNDLKNGKHSCIKLQQAYAKHGADNFSFSTLETLPQDCTRGDLFAAEQSWIDRYWDDGLLYNVNQRADTAGREHTAETRERISISRKGKAAGKNAAWYGKRQSDEVLKRQSAAMRGKLAGEKHPMYGKSHSAESISKMSASQKGRQAGEKNPNYGKKMSDEQKARISASKKGKLTGKDSPSYGLKRSAETRRRISSSLIGKSAGEKNPNYGKKMSDEQKAKVSASRKGKCTGEEVKSSKLTWNKVREIREKRSSGVPAKVLAAEYDVDVSQIYNIVSFRQWVPSQ